MPSRGLYPIAKHHIYGHGRQMPPPARQLFNSMDYVQETYLQDNAVQATGVTVKSSVEQAPTGSDTKAKKSKDKKKGSKRTADEHRDLKKKRKRESEIHVTSPTASRKEPATEAFVVNTDWLKGVEISMGTIDSALTQMVDAPSSTAKPSKKKTKSRKKGAGERADEAPSQPTIEPRIEERRAKKQKKNRKSSLALNDNMDNTPAGTPTLGPKSFHNIQRKQTPVRNSQVPTSSTPSGTQKKVAQHDSSGVDVLVPETPPSKSTQRAKLSTPVLFPKLLPPGATTSGRKLTKKERLTSIVSTPTSSSDGQIPASAPAAQVKALKSSQSSNGHLPLTPGNLMRYTQPLNDETKPRPRSRGISVATSGGASLPDSQGSTSMDIRQAFARTGKPYERLGAIAVPFDRQEARKKKYREPHTEAPLDVFNTKFFDLQAAIDFTNEASYLDKYVDWNVTNRSKDPLPCLGQATGCTPKKEQILRFSREEDMNVLSFMGTNGGDMKTLDQAALRTREAESFLLMAVKAQIPVPIGRLEGSWALYCPKYSESHFDRYGFGKRTLTISTIAGFRDKNMYTACLTIPPRPMSYTILTFAVPPHASFRTTTIKTSAEGYKMEIVFLGNGYLQLRGDLNLLLRGKPTEMVDGKKMYMEFVGVHESAMQWVQVKDELKEAGKQLIAKFDSVDGN